MNVRVALLVLLPALLATATFGAAPSAPWLADLPTAQGTAKREGKFVLIHFSGSDWCGWCMKLRKDVFSKSEFEAYAKSNLILVTIDFPKHKRLPAATESANQRVAEQFQVQGFPTLILLDSQGTKLGAVNYAQGGPKAFLAEVEKLAHPPRELPPLKPKPVASPGLRRARNNSRDASTDPRELVLTKITTSKHGRQAIINHRTLIAGQVATIPLAAGSVQVRCLEIREKSVLVSVEGERARRELKLAGGT